MNTNASLTAPPPLTLRHWLICAIAAPGLAFDICELPMLPLSALFRPNESWRDRRQSRPFPTHS